MGALLFFLLRLLVSPFRSISRLEAENSALRRQLIVLQRQVLGRVQFTNSDRLFFIQLYRWFPSIVKAMTTIRPETLVRWHRAGFRRYWRWKSRNLGGRPPIDAGPRALISRMSTRIRFGVRRAFMASCSSSALRSLSRPWQLHGQHKRPPVWSELGQLPAQTICRRLQPWTCSWSRPSALTYCTF